MRIHSQEPHFRHKVWMACLEKMHHSRLGDNWQYGASSQPKEYELKFFLKLLYFLFLKENLAAKIDIINIINCSRHIAHDRSSFNSPSTMLMNECHFFCWFLYIGDNDDNMIFFGSYCLFVALVVKFAPSLRSGDANVTTQDTNKQYALQKSCYCLIHKNMINRNTWLQSKDMWPVQQIIFILVLPFQFHHSLPHHFLIIR